MIRVSTGFAIAAGFVSLSLHLSGIAVMWGKNPVQIQGGAPAAVTQLGNSFRNLVEGVRTPAKAEQLLETEDFTDLTLANATEAPPEQSLVKGATPTLAHSATYRTVVPEVPRETVVPASREAFAVQSVPPERVATVIPSSALNAGPALQAVSPEPVPSQVLTALSDTEGGTAAQVSKRQSPPAQRVETAQIRPAKPEPSPVAVQKPQPTRGQQQPKEVAGSAAGQQNGIRAQTSESNRQAAQPGNAAVSNYPGKVVRKIRRVRRPRMRGVRGTTHLAFSVAGNGALASLRITRTSGNAQLDQAALQILRAAAPFPKPPQGAQTAFSYRVSY